MKNATFGYEPTKPLFVNVDGAVDLESKIALVSDRFLLMFVDDSMFISCLLSIVWQ